MSTSERLVLDGIVRPLAGEPGRVGALLPSHSVQCHAANLMPLGDGDLGCVWFGGTQEGMSDISIHVSRLDRGTDRWTPAVRLEDDPTRSEQNPILFPAPDGRLLLLYTSQRSGNQDTAVVRFRTSLDNGHSWSVPATLIGTAGTFVRQPLHVRANGDWLLPIFECRTPSGERWTGSHDTSAVMISPDQGRTWERRPVPDSIGAVHMNIVDAGRDGLVALFRSRFADHIHLSRSVDGGLTWSAPEPTALPNNNSSIQAAALADGRLALVYNAASVADAIGRRQSLYDDIEDDAPAAASGMPSKPSAPPSRTAFWGAPRAPLCLSLSSDAGRTWEAPLTLGTSDGYCMTNNSKEKLNRELSYPSIKQGADGRIHIAYTYFRQAIRYTAFDRL